MIIKNDLYNNEKTEAIIVPSFKLENFEKKSKKKEKVLRKN